MTADKRRPPASSSVWIDPAVSAFLGELIGEEHTQTPIPARASAQPEVTVRPKYSYIQPESFRENDLTRIPTMPPPNSWQYESPDFQAESSLSSLSLVRQAPTVSPNSTRNLASNDEVDTLPYMGRQQVAPPPQRQMQIEDFDTSPFRERQRPQPRHQVQIEEIDTIPPRALAIINSLPTQFSPVIPANPVRSIVPVSP